MRRVAVVVRTSRSIHRVCQHPRRERSNVDRVYRRLWVQRRGRLNEFVRLSPGDAQSGLSPSKIVDDVPALVDFQHRFEFCVHDDVDGLLERCSEMHLDAQVALLYQTEARPHHTSPGVRSKPKKVYPSRKSSRVRPFPSSCDTLPVDVKRLR